MKTIVFDFDGVIHKYSKGWQGSYDIYDEPVPGIKDVIEELRRSYKVVIVSTRCSKARGRKEILNWLDRYGIMVDDVLEEKPPAICYIDDRAICFDGNTKTLIDKIKNFKTWREE